MAASVRRQVLVTGRGEVATARDPFARAPLRRVSTVGLEESRAAAQALGGSINDVFVTGVAGALGRYHDRLGVAVDELRMAMPVSTRGAHQSTAGNRFVPTRVVVPITPKEPTGRFDQVQRQDHERAPRARARRGRLVRRPRRRAADVGARRRCCATRRTIDFATSNLRGSPVDLYLGGARIDGSYPMGPRSGCRSTSRCCRTAATCASGSTPTPPRSPTRTHSSSACASRSTRCSPPASDAVRALRAAHGRRGAGPAGATASSHSSWPGIAPEPVVAARRAVDHVEVQRRRVVGELEELVRAAVRRRGVEQVGERDDREHPAPALGARRHRRRFEPAGDPSRLAASSGSSSTRSPSSSTNVRSAMRATYPAPTAERPSGRPAGSVVAHASSSVSRRRHDRSSTERPDPEPGRRPGARAGARRRAQPGRPAPAGRLLPRAARRPRRHPGHGVRGRGRGARRRRRHARGRRPGVRDRRRRRAGRVPRRARDATARACPDHLDLVDAGGDPRGRSSPRTTRCAPARGLQPGEHVLVHAVGSGVGTAVVQLAKALGCTVTGTARTETKLDRARELGLDHGVPAAVAARRRRARGGDRRRRRRART